MTENLKNKKINFIKKDTNTLFFNGCFDKNRIKYLVSWSLNHCGQEMTIQLIENLKNIGFSYATQAGVSLGIDDLRIPLTKNVLISTAEKNITKTQINFNQEYVTGIEKFQHLIDTWHRTSEILKQHVVSNFKLTDILNPVYMMAFSGARGNVSQVRQLVGMRGLMSDPQGQILDFPIKSNFREGITLTEYIISCYGARKGLVDTALKTANSGYLTRRLVDVAHHIIVCRVDCKTNRGVLLSNILENKKIIIPLRSRLPGRILAENIYSNNNDLTIQNSQFQLKQASKTALFFFLIQRNLFQVKLLEYNDNKASKISLEPSNTFQNIPLTFHAKITKLIEYLKKNRDYENNRLLNAETQRILQILIYRLILEIQYSVINNNSGKKLIAKKNQEISIQLAEKIADLRKAVLVRSPLTCEIKNSICQLCYGWSLAHGKLVSLGEAVGVIAAQSIGEPGTQLTMRTFHTGGVFSGDIMSEITAPFNGKILFSTYLPGTLIRTPHGKIAFLTKVQGSFEIQEIKIEQATKLNNVTFQIPPLTVLFTRNYEYVKKDQVVAEFSSMSTDANQRIIASRDSNSEFEGEMLFKNLWIEIKTRTVIKTGVTTLIHRKTITLGSIWILSGKLCKQPFPINVFPKPGDLIDNNSVIAQYESIPILNGFFQLCKKVYLPSIVSDTILSQAYEASWSESQVNKNKKKYNFLTEKKIFKDKKKSVNFLSDSELKQSNLSIDKTNQLSNENKNWFQAPFEFIQDGLPANLTLKKNKFCDSGSFDLFASQASVSYPLIFSFIQFINFKKIGYFFKNQTIFSKIVYKNTLKQSIEILNCQKNLIFPVILFRQNKNSEQNWCLPASFQPFFESSQVNLPANLIFEANKSYDFKDPVVHSLNTCDQFFLGNSLNQEFKNSKNLKGKFFFQNFPSKYQTKTNGILIYDAFYLNKKACCGEAFWIAEETYTIDQSCYIYKIHTYFNFIQNTLQKSNKILKTHKKSQFSTNFYTSDFPKNVTLKNNKVYLSKYTFNQNSFNLNPIVSILYLYNYSIKIQNLIKRKKIKNDVSFNTTLIKKSYTKVENNNFLKNSKKRNFSRVYFNQIRLQKYFFNNKKNYINKIYINLKKNSLLNSKKQAFILNSVLENTDLKLLTKKRIPILQAHFPWKNFSKKTEKINVAFKKNIIDRLIQAENIYSTRKISFTKVNQSSHQSKYLKQSINKNTIKFKWIYFSHNLKFDIKKHNQIIKPGENYFNVFLFDQYPVYCRYILIDKIKNKFYKEKNINLQKQIQFLKILTKFNSLNLNNTTNTVVINSLFNSKTHSSLFFGENFEVFWTSFCIGLQKINKKQNSTNLQKTKRSKTQYIFSKLKFKNVLKDFTKRINLNKAKKAKLRFIYKKLLLKIILKKNSLAKLTQLKWLVENIYRISLNEKNSKIEYINLKTMYFVKNTFFTFSKRFTNINVDKQTTLIVKKYFFKQFVSSFTLQKNKIQVFELVRFQKNKNSCTHILTFTFSLHILNKKLDTFTSLKIKNIKQINLVFFSKIVSNITTKTNFSEIFYYSSKNIVEKNKNLFLIIGKLTLYTFNEIVLYKRVFSQHNQRTQNAILFSNTIKQQLPNFTKKWLLNKQNKTNLFFNFPGADFSIKYYFKHQYFKQIVISKKTSIFQYSINFEIPKYYKHNNAKTLYTCNTKLEHFKNKFYLNVAIYLNVSLLIELKLFTRPIVQKSKVSVSNKVFLNDNVKTSQSKILLLPNNTISSATPLSFTNLLSLYDGEILEHSKLFNAKEKSPKKREKYNFLILTDTDQKKFSIENINKNLQEKNSQKIIPLNEILEVSEDNKFPLVSKKQKVKKNKTTNITSLYVGKLVNSNTKIKKNLVIPIAGEILEIEKSSITLRKAQTIFLPANGLLSVYDGEIVEKNTLILRLFYQRLKTGDIVQGIPKIEQLFEARRTNQGELLSGSLHEQLEKVFFYYISIKECSFSESAKYSLEKIQQIIINSVQKVYKSQGVTISDKHLEIIIRQMTAKVEIIGSGQTNLLPGEIIDLDWIEIVNQNIENVTQKAKYMPVILGITRKSLDTKSFISEASFQETTRVLAKSAIERKTDFLKGLKENVILGHLIPAGTGFHFDSVQLKYSEEKIIESIKIFNAIFPLKKPTLKTEKKKSKNFSKVDNHKN